MRIRSLKHVFAWPEDRPSAAAEHALDWATRLNLPLRTAVVPAPDEPSSLIVWENHGGPSAASLAMQAALQRRNALHLLVGPPPHGAMNLVVLYDQCIPKTAFLVTVASLCQALEVVPLVLAVGSTETMAHSQQLRAEKACACLGVEADFEAIAGSDLRQTLGRAVSWLGCSHLIVEQRDPLRDVLEPARALTDNFAILAVPEGVVVEVGGKARAKFGPAQEVAGLQEHSLAC